MKSNRKFTKNDAAFTGLEAAIVLIAFVVVAAVFSYVMLGAGFFTSQKSKEVVHTGVDQATSSILLSGDVIGTDTGATGTLTAMKVTVGLTAGNNPVDLTKLVVSYQSGTYYNDNIYGSPGAAGVDFNKIVSINTNDMLSQNEKAELELAIPAGGQVGPNTKVTIDIKPAAGADLPITFNTPATIDPVMVLM